MWSIRDITGMRFGRLTALGKTDKRKNGAIVWKFACDCGTTKEMLGTTVRRGLTKSCGCMALENRKACGVTTRKGAS